jgi:hypothetical protein
MPSSTENTSPRCGAWALEDVRRGMGGFCRRPRPRSGASIGERSGAIGPWLLRAAERSCIAEDGPASGAEPIGVLGPIVPEQNGGVSNLHPGWDTVWPHCIRENSVTHHKPALAACEAFLLMGGHQKDGEYRWVTRRPMRPRWLRGKGPWYWRPRRWRARNSLFCLSLSDMNCFGMPIPRTH